jgi:hypothetical protein
MGSVGRIEILKDAAGLALYPLQIRMHGDCIWE